MVLEIDDLTPNKTVLQILPVMLAGRWFWTSVGMPVYVVYAQFFHGISLKSD